MRLLNNRRGFTLIELLVVILVVAVLLAIAVPAYLAQQVRAKDAKTKQYLNYAYRNIRAELPEANNAFQASTSLVSQVQASEPQLSVLRGDCIGGLLTASPDAIIVDKATTQSSLTLCAKSASGNLWKLAASPTSAPTLLDGSAVGLSVSTGLITDSSRLAGSEGDGRAPPDSSTGSWAGTTNLIQNGGFESSTGLGWGDDLSSGGGVVRTRDSSTAVFGSSSLRLVTAGTGTEEGTRYGASPQLPLSPNTTYTASAWLKGSGSVGFFLDLYNGSSAYQNSVGYYTLGGLGAITLTGSWQRYSFTFTTSASIARGNPSVRTLSAQATTFWVDGVQVEQTAIATPYVETNGSTRGRSAARISAPSSALNATQGWFAARVRMGYPSTATPGTYSGLAAWGDGSVGNDAIMLHRTNSQWRMERSSGGTTSSAYSAAQSWSTGSYFTVVGAWTSTQVRISVDGAAFVSAANTTIPAPVATTFDIGVGQYVNNALRWCDCDVMWFATGTGTLSNGDASAINGWGNSDPKRIGFSLACAGDARLGWDERKWKPQVARR